ncbi:MAG TPA: HAD family hydrolase [Candidatus Acidoferrum sp.]|nr:HAD family hydrolase [Candidatus Acidoferrum sp.]
MTAIGFDFDHTLGVDNGLEREAFYRYAEELGRPLDRKDPLVHERIEKLLLRFRSGSITLHETARLFGEWLGLAADVERYREICYSLVDELVRPVDGARETIAALREQGVRMAILTNGWTPLQQMKIARALGEDAIEPVLVSDALNALKPAREAFDALVAALGVDRSDVWYVGDNPVTDIGGALAAGLRAVWFDWEGLKYPADIPPPTLRITTLRELETLVENTTAP